MIPETEKENRNKSTTYLKYGGLAFQLMGIVAISFFLGRYIDTKLGFSQPYIAILLIISTFTGYMYKLYKELFND